MGNINIRIQAQRMIGHYVEDDALDAFSLAGIVQHDSSLAITTSQTLNDISDWLLPLDVDFVLLDINRPDTKSLSDDVDRIRQCSKAPIIFITGDDPVYYREQANLAGAQAVIEKNNLTLDELHTVLKNVVISRQDEHGENVLEHGLLEATLSDSLPGRDEQRLNLVLAYLQSLLTSLAGCECDKKQLQSTLDLIARSFASLKSYSRSVRTADSRASLAPSTPAAIRSLQKAALATAAKRNVRLTFQMNQAALDGITDLESVQLGIRHLLHASITDAPAGSIVAFNASPTAQGMRLTISSSEQLAFSDADAFERTLPAEAHRFNSTISMSLALLLLELDRSDVLVFSKGSLHTMTVDYQH